MIDINLIQGHYREHHRGEQHLQELKLVVTTILNLIRVLTIFFLFFL